MSREHSLLRSTMPPLTTPVPVLRAGRLAALLAVLVLAGCGYSHYAGPLEPASQQAPSMVIADDGSVSYVQGRFEVRLRPLTDEELNRQFASSSVDGPKSTNPYTYGNTEFYEVPKHRQRFTVFRLSVKNYAYPKVKVDPKRIQLVADNGREYWSLDTQQLDNYYRIYAAGYQGNAYIRYRDRRDLLNRTMFVAAEIFSGQESDGLVVFPDLHPDVSRVRAIIHDVVLRFDYRNEPVETTELTYGFRRDIGRLYPEGRLELSTSR